MREQKAGKWSVEQARDWQQRMGWLCGCNFLPSTAVNSTEMWQAETFDTESMRRELGWAAGIGFNSIRVFLQYLVWQDDPDGFGARFEQLLEIADGHGMNVMPVLFDDCAFSGKQPYLGKQQDSVSGVHNSAWTPSPGHDRAEDPEAQEGLRAYVTDLLTRFGQDRRVVSWDLYNEPGNSDRQNRSLPLLESVFEWARAVTPDQPLSAGLWSWDTGMEDLNAFQIANSDIVTFHLYKPLEETRNLVRELKSHGRPVLCTEWMARHFESFFTTHLPMWREENVGCYNWGLVVGKTQTHYPWGSKAGDPEPDPWFHDVFRPDGSPYDIEEIGAIRNVCPSTDSPPTG